MATMTAREAADRLFKPIQQFTRGWMMAKATAQRGVELGLPSGHEFWVIGRAGVLGDCHPEVAAAGLAFIAPGAVREAYEKLPVGLSPLDVAREYGACCTGWGSTELARFDADRMERLDALGRRTIDAAPASLGAIFAGWRVMPRPADVGGRVALTTHVLREMRGAAHIAAVIAAGLSPLDAILASPAPPPRSGPEWAGHMRWEGPFRDPEEVRGARGAAEEATAAVMATWFGVLDGEELADFTEIVATTRDDIDM